MKRIFLVTMLLLFTTALHAQSYVGLLNDNYAGVHNVVSNPSEIVDSRLRTDINLAGASVFLGNDYIEVSLREALFSEFDFDDAEKTLKDKNNFYGNLDILGPSVMFNINRKNAVAIFTRARLFYNITDINGQTFENFEQGFDANTDFTIDENDFNLSTNSWTELGLTYARELYNKNEHYLKGGLSLKYLEGIGNVYAGGNDVNIIYNNGTNPDNSTITTSGIIAFGNSAGNNLDNFTFGANTSGFAVDLGFTYEWRPNYNSHILKDSRGRTFVTKHTNKYKLKLGISLTDLGSLSYTSGAQERYDITNTITETQFNQTDDLETLLERNYNRFSTSELLQPVLPAALHISGDYLMNKYLYLSFNSSLSLVARDRINSNRIGNVISVTPRFERKWFSFFTPVSYFQHSGLQWGAGLRAGPIYFGSGTVVSALVGNKSKAVDAFAGIKIPIYESKPKDRDGDGVLDMFDDCPKDPGTAANYGCPEKDSDGDSVLDKDDTCPQQAGPAENMGCPWTDKDGDTILDKDDACPDVAGPVENNGCPFVDSDGDGVLDKDDDCPQIAGIRSNKGCPEKIQPVMTEIEEKQLNEYAKVILFNSGTDVLKDESFTTLNQIAAQIKEYPFYRFVIEGHTDNVGTEVSNLMLSQKRAKAVVDYLIGKGVSSEQLSTQGYGESKPLVANDTEENKARNRRVEIKLTN